MNNLKNIIKPIAFIRNPTFLGQSRFGVNVAPYVLVNKAPDIDYNLDHTYESFLSDIEMNNERDNTPEQIEELMKKEPFLVKFKSVLLENLGTKIVNERLQNEYERVLNIGGDHSIAIGSVAASLEKYGDNLKVVWVDAHADLNSYDHSPSKNIHGMAVNYLMGLEKRLPQWLKDNKLKPEQLIYIGLRSIDPYEKQAINALGIECISSDEIKEHGIKDLLNIYEDLTYENVHLSLDVDVMDPSIFPSTGTPVENGLSYQEVIDIIDFYFPKMTCMDLVEFNPYIGNMQEIKASQKIAGDLLKYVYNKSIEE